MKNYETARSRLAVTATALSLAALAAGSAAASQPRLSAANAPAATPATHAMRAYIDPKTGRLRPATTDEIAAEVRAIHAKSAAPVQMPKASQRAGGGILITDTQGLLQESVVVSRSPDGTLSYSFVTGDTSKAIEPAAAASNLEEK